LTEAKVLIIQEMHGYKGLKFINRPFSTQNF
jgi:hypothetical protein